MPSRLVLLLSAVLAFAPGCALTTVVMHANTNFGQHRDEEHVPIGNQRTREVEVTLVPAAAEPPQEPSAAASPAGAALPPGPAAGTAPFHFQCSVKERAGRERIIDRYVIYDANEKSSFAIFAGLDTAMALAAFLVPSKDSSGARAWRVFGGVVSVDALALVGMILFAKEQPREDTYEQLGRWYPLAASCPADLVAQTASVTAPVDAGGRIDPALETALVRDLVLQQNAVELHLSGITKLAPVDDAIRCRLAQDRGYRTGPGCLQLLAHELAPVTFRLQKTPISAP